MGSAFSSRPVLDMTEVNVVDLSEGDHIAVKHGLKLNHALFMGHCKGTVVTIDRYSKTVVETSLLNFITGSTRLLRVEYNQQVCVPAHMATENAARLSKERPFVGLSADSFRFVYHVRINCEGSKLIQPAPVSGMAKKHNLDQSIPCSTSASMPSTTEVFPLASQFAAQHIELDSPQHSLDRYPMYRCEPVQGFSDFRIPMDEQSPLPSPAKAGARQSIQLGSQSLTAAVRVRRLLEAGGRVSLDTERLNDELLSVRHIELSQDSGYESSTCLGYGENKQGAPIRRIGNSNSPTVSEFELID